MLSDEKEAGTLKKIKFTIDLFMPAILQYVTCTRVLYCSVTACHICPNVVVSMSPDVRLRSQNTTKNRWFRFPSRTLFEQIT